SLVKTVQERGGILTTDDFALYKAVERTPIETYYHGRRVITGSAPTSGSVLLNMLNVVEGFTLALDGPTATNYHRIVEAMKFGAAQRTLLGDPSFVDIAANLTRQISKEFASEIRANISDTQTFDVSHYDPEYDVLNNHGTTHLSIVDKDEMAVALTSTINLEFGSRIMDPSTGIILNDEMDDFSTTNQTNGFGLRPSPNNKIVPRKRPLSSTSATIIENNGHVELIKAVIFATAAIAGSATATLDILTGRPLSEAIFGLSSEQVKKVDTAVNRVEKNMETSVINAFTLVSKSMVKVYSEINKNSSAAVIDATKALGKALTPDVRDKLKKAINSVVDSTLNAIL
ncbi:hypothetical protein GGH16_003347, partial [Coemansia sp. RSA 560]